jgi:rRNA maturation endonuclease Nob1
VPKPISYADRLKEQLQSIEDQALQLIDASTIDRFVNDPYSGVIILAPEFYWGKANEGQQRLQLRLKETYSDWFERFGLFFGNAPEEMQSQIEETHTFVTKWIDQDNSSWDIPATIEQAKLKFREELKNFHELIEVMRDPQGSEAILIPDTNALISAPDLSHYSAVIGRPDYAVIVVPTVLEELDKLKVNHRDRDFRNKVASVIRRLKGLRQQGSLLEGVTVNKTVTVKMVAREPNFRDTLHWLDPANNDDRIIASALQLQRSNPSSTVVLVTSDINLQNKAEMASLPFSEPPTPT